jgi:predicted MFS family arabinose efflux permease
MFASAWFLLKEPPLPPRVAHGRWFMEQHLHVIASIWQQIKNVLRPEMLLPALLMFFIQAVPTFRSTSFYEYQTKTLHYSDAALGWLGLAGYAVALLSSGVYAWWCRKASLRASLYLAIFVTALSCLPYLFYTAYTPYMPRAMAIEGVGTFLQYLAYLPLFDLAVRCTPKGSEALGYSLLLSVWNIGLMIGGKTGPMLYERWLNKNMNDLIWINALVTLAGVVIVFLMPKTLVDKSEGK